MTTGDDRARDEARWRLAALEESLDDAVVTTTVEGTITSWSQGAERLYGYRAEDAIGCSLSLIVPPDHRGEVQGLLAQVTCGSTVAPHHTVRRTHTGGDLEVEVRMTAMVDAQRRPVGVVIVDRDLTEQLWVAQTLDTTLGRLEAALAEARASEERSRGFLADAAHQLRSPLASIRLCTETLLRGAEPAERDHLLADLVRQTARAGRLVASLLRIARLDEGEELVPQPCDLLAVCRDEADRVWHLAPQLDVVLRADGLPEDGLKLDEGAVREIVANLLENAIRYAASKFELVITVGADAVELRVADDGPGLPPGMEERAFERFVTLDEKGRYGLGLPIARELARAHGGDLTYEQGAFVVRLPASMSSTQ